MGKKLGARQPRVKIDQTWIRARQELLSEARRTVAGKLGPEPADLRRFRRRYERELHAPWQIADKAELLNAVGEAEIVYGGDFHALGQAQRTHVKILRALPSAREVTLALECFSTPAQKWLDLYLSGAVDLKELKARTRWAQTWGFPFENYRPLFEIAKKRGYRLLALGSASRKKSALTLTERERSAANVLARELKLKRKTAGALVYVVFGDLHLAVSHLPTAVGEALEENDPPRALILHLNPENVYFELAQKGLELSVDVVKFAPTARQTKAGAGWCFGVLSTPPWVVWQSYMLFLEQTENEAALASSEDELGDFGEDFDPTDQVVGFVRLAARDLGVAGEILNINDLSVYLGGSPTGWRRLERSLRGPERRLAREWLLSGQNLFLPDLGAGYLGQPTVNHAAALAGSYLHARLSLRDRTLWNVPKDFSALIWTEAVAYFFSKHVNHKRQPETLVDLNRQLAVLSPADQGREAMRLAVDRFMSEVVRLKQNRKRPVKVRPRRKTSYFEAARILGGMLGERLYMAHRSRKLKTKEIVKFLRVDVTLPGFAQTYFEILARIGDLETPVKTKRERL